VFIEAKDDGGGGDNWTTGAISRAKLQSFNVCVICTFVFLVCAKNEKCHLIA